MEPGKFYHIYNHGNGSDNLFRTDENYHYFLKKFADHVNPIADTFAWCLMPNHFHFLIQIKEEEEVLDYYKLLKPGKDLSGFHNLTGLVSKSFSNFFNGYTKAYNEKFNRKGKLFLQSFKRKEVTNGEYLCKLIYYIHSNPVHHGFTKSVDEWTYSSYQSFLSLKPTKVQRDEVLKLFYGTEEFTRFHKQPVDRKIMLEMDF